MRALGQAMRVFGLGGTALAAMVFLSGCESAARQDSFNVRGTTTAVLMPATVHKPEVHTLPNSAPDSPVAYETPAAPSYPDRPLDENLGTSLEMADYVRALGDTGLLPLLDQAGPFTVFGIPNTPLEAYSAAYPGGLRAPANLPAMKRLLGYTIVRGAWDEGRLRRAIARQGAGAVGLKTLYGDVLTVRLESSTGQLVLVNREGETNRLWLTGVPQSNGILYFTQGVLRP